MLKLDKIITEITSGDKKRISDVACLPEVPTVLLEKLSHNSLNAVRISLATNPSLPLKLLYKLSKDENITVRVNVARHKKLSDDLRTQMFHKGEKLPVLVALVETCDSSEILSHFISVSDDVRIMRKMAENPALTNESAYSIINSVDDARIVRKILRNSNLSAGFLADYYAGSVDNDYKTLCALVRAPNVSKETVDSIVLSTINERVWYDAYILRKTSDDVRAYLEMFSSDQLRDAVKYYNQYLHNMERLSVVRT